MFHYQSFHFNSWYVNSWSPRTRCSHTGSKALTVSYDKSAPQFQIFRFLRTRNIPFATLTVAFLLCNVSAVALAVLFSETTRNFGITTEVFTYHAPKLQAGFTQPAQEIYFLLAEHHSGHAAGLTSTTPEYFVPPVPPVSPHGVGKYVAHSIGIGVGVGVKCDLVPVTNNTMRCDNHGCVASPSAKLDKFPRPSWSVLGPFRLLCNDQQKFTLNYTWEGLSQDNIFQSSGCPNTGVFFTLYPPTEVLALISIFNASTTAAPELFMLLLHPIEPDNLYLWWLNFERLGQMNVVSYCLTGWLWPAPRYKNFVSWQYLAAKISKNYYKRCG